MPKLTKIDNTLIICNALILLYCILVTMQLLPNDLNRIVQQYIADTHVAILDIAASFFNGVGSKLVTLLMFLVLTAWLYQTSDKIRVRNHMIFFFVTMLLFSLVKFGFFSPRPDYQPGMAHDSSFPSGHVNRVLLLTSCLYFYLRQQLSAHAKRLSILGIVLMTFVCAWSRLYVNEHWLTDVAAAISYTLIALIIYRRMLSQDTRDSLRNPFKAAVTH